MPLKELVYLSWTCVSFNLLVSSDIHTRTKNINFSQIKRISGWVAVFWLSDFKISRWRECKQQLVIGQWPTKICQCLAKSACTNTRNTEPPPNTGALRNTSKSPYQQMKTNCKQSGVGLINHKQTSVLVFLVLILVHARKSQPYCP